MLIQPVRLRSNHEPAIDFGGPISNWMAWLNIFLWQMRPIHTVTVHTWIANSYTCKLVNMFMFLILAVCSHVLHNFPFSSPAGCTPPPNLPWPCYHGKERPLPFCWPCNLAVGCHQMGQRPGPWDPGTPRDPPQRAEGLGLSKAVIIMFPPFLDLTGGNPPCVPTHYKSQCWTWSILMVKPGSAASPWWAGLRHRGDSLGLPGCAAAKRTNVRRSSRQGSVSRAGCPFLYLIIFMFLL